MHLACVVSGSLNAYRSHNVPVISVTEWMDIHILLMESPAPSRGTDTNQHNGKPSNNGVFRLQGNADDKGIVLRSSLLG